MRPLAWKSVIKWSTVIALSVSAPAIASAQQVSGTPHDLSSTAVALGITNYNQICVYCHTPHNASAVAPLWNRAFGAGPYTMYTNANSATMDMLVGTTPGPVSKACLSCHDGTIGLDVVSHTPDASTYTPVVNTVKMTGDHNLGTDLTDDHPIAVTYNTALDPAFIAAVSGKVDVLPLYGATKNQVECATCHNPHNNTNVPFLRKTNLASALCLTCHIK